MLEKSRVLEDKLHEALERTAGSSELRELQAQVEGLLASLESKMDAADGIARLDAKLDAVIGTELQAALASPP